MEIRFHLDSFMPDIGKILKSQYFTKAEIQIIMLLKHRQERIKLHCLFLVH